MEDFVNYKENSMFLITCMCDWKCCHEANIPITVCQNEPIAKQQTKEYSNESIFNAYVKNDITKSICIGGLEPMLQFDEVYSLIKYFRDNKCEDDFVIYSGYNENEISDKIEKLKTLNNIVIKFGRFVPNQEKHFDDVLGVFLASKNQYGKRL